MSLRQDETTFFLPAFYTKNENSVAVTLYNTLIYQKYEDNFFERKQSLGIPNFEKMRYHFI